MAPKSAKTVNVPPADLLLQFIRDIIADVYAENPMLKPTLPLLQSAADAILAQIGQANEDPAFLAAKQAANAGDGRLDKAHRYAVYTLEAQLLNDDEAVAAAAASLLDLLYPERLAIITLAYVEAAAAGATYAARLALPRAQAAIATLTAVLPTLAADLGRTVTLATELGAAVQKLNGFYTDKAGNALNPKLFAARTSAQQRLSAFSDFVATMAYPDDTPEHAKARTSLTGPYRRYLTSNLSGAAPADEATPASDPTP